jgi:hypothetical protein
MKTTQEFSREIGFAINHALDAHTNHPNAPKDTVRFWDNHTPYAIHPIWCGITLLTETKLPEKVRLDGYLALMWHDILEDTTLGLPEATNPDVTQLVNEMTFKSFHDEQVKIGSSRDVVKLLKLYDKVSILLDAAWMDNKKWNQLVEYTLTLRQHVLDTYGDLNIVKIAKAVCISRNIE